MKLGIEVSKEGFDVKTASHKNKIFTSELNQIKIIKTLTATFTKTGNPQEIFSLAHNLGYTPGFIPFLKVSSRWYGNCGNDPTSDLTWMMCADTTNIYAKVTNGAGTSFTIKVFVLADRGSNASLGSITQDTIGMKVSVQGEDAPKTKDQNLAFSSAFETFQIVKIITSQNDRTGSVERTVVHGLPYTPAWFAVGVDNKGNPNYIMPYLLIGSRELMVWSDGTNVGNRIESIVPPPNEDITFKIAVLTNKLE